MNLGIMKSLMRRKKIRLGSDELVWIHFQYKSQRTTGVNDGL